VAEITRGGKSGATPAMSVRVLWLPEALDDIERLHALLQEKSPSAASRAAQAILDGARLRETAPEAGRPPER